jgi:Tfp pilus assembly protein PilF
MESLMQSLPRLLFIGIAGIALAAPVASQRPDDQILPKSSELQRQAKDLISAGKFEQAEDLLETSLAIDPRNRGAFVDIARVAEKQHLFGKAILMTSKALAIDVTLKDNAKAFESLLLRVRMRPIADEALISSKTIRHESGLQG